MRITVHDDFDLNRMAESGQCFRWEKLNGGYRIITGSSVLDISQETAHRLNLDCTADEFNRIWRPYFDLDTDYRAIRAGIDAEQDPVLYQASEREKGVRILRQDPWETMVSFIISQNRNIPAIKKSIHLLCEMAGEPMSKGGETVSLFPEPEAVAALTEEELRSCKLGYRAPYIREAAGKIVSGEMSLSVISGMDDDSALSELQKCRGIGKKVASCILLFGFHRLNAFPVDVWVRRAEQECYPRGFPVEKYSPYSGVMQQYLFMYFRSGAAKN